MIKRKFYQRRKIVLNREGNPLKVERLRVFFRRYRRKAKISEKFIVHSLRHSFATKLVEEGVPLVLVYHPHIHVIVPAGGIDKMGKWRNSKKKFFIPVKVLSRKFRGKFLYYLKQEKLDFYGEQEYLGIKENFDELMPEKIDERMRQRMDKYIECLL